MKDEIFFRDKLEDEWEANEVYAILSECDKVLNRRYRSGEALFKRHGRKNLVTVSEITLMRMQTAYTFIKKREENHCFSVISFDGRM